KLSAPSRPASRRHSSSRAASTPPRPSSSPLPPVPRVWSPALRSPTTRRRSVPALRRPVTGSPSGVTRERIGSARSRGLRPPALRARRAARAGPGVRRFVLGHATGESEVAEIAAIAHRVDADLLVAGGVSDETGLRRVRDAGAAGIILGEALLSGAIDYQTAR